MERAAGNGTQSAQGETRIDPPAQQHPTRARGQQTGGDAAELAQLASQIRQCHERYVSSVRTNLEHAMEVGGLLLQAKRQIGHGGFTAWMRSACPFLSPSTGRAYMQLAKARPEVQALLQAKHQPAGVLTLKAVLKAIAQDGRRNAPAQAASPEPADAQQAAEGPVAGSEASVAIGVPAGSEIRAPGGMAGVAMAPRPEPSVDSGHGPAGEDPDVLAQVAEPPPGPAQSERPDATTVQSTATLAEAPPPDSDPESGLSDADWLETLPLRAVLSDSAAYDADAILWRAMSAERQRIEQVVRPTETDRRLVLTQQWRNWPFRTLAAHFLGVRHPREWKVCFLCGGSGKSQALGGPCIACCGAGYELAHEVEPSQAVG